MLSLIAAVAVFATIDPTYIAFAGVAAGLAGPLVAYLAAARRFSGKIASSDASELWAESKSIREHLHEEIAALKRRVAGLEQDNRNLATRLETCRRRVAELEAPHARP